MDRTDRSRDDNCTRVATRARPSPIRINTTAKIVNDRGIPVLTHESKQRRVHNKDDLRFELLDMILEPWTNKIQYLRVETETLSVALFNHKLPLGQFAMPDGESTHRSLCESSAKNQLLPRGLIPIRDAEFVFKYKYHESMSLSKPASIVSEESYKGLDIGVQ